MCFIYYISYPFKHLFAKKASMHRCRIIGVAPKYPLMGKLGAKTYLFFNIFLNFYLMNAAKTSRQQLFII